MDTAVWGVRVPQVHGYCHEDPLLSGIGDETIVGSLCPADDRETWTEGGAIVSSIGCQLERDGGQEVREGGRR